MASSNKKGSLGVDTNRPVIDRGTAVRTSSPPPGPVCSAGGSITRNKWNWTAGHFIVWQLWRPLPSKFGGGDAFLFRYKDAWVAGHKASIIRYSRMYGLPPVLLAGIAWNEVGGKPDEVDVPAYIGRTFDHLGDPLLEPLTITKPPRETSVGDVQIQLRRAAETLGLDFDKLSALDRAKLLECLYDEEANLEIVARHLWQLKEMDFPNRAALGDEEIRIIGARYNRGPQFTLEEIKRDTSNGDAILRHKARLLKLLQ